MRGQNSGLALRLRAHFGADVSLHKFLVQVCLSCKCESDEHEAGPTLRAFAADTAGNCSTPAHRSGCTMATAASICSSSTLFGRLKSISAALFTKFMAMAVAPAGIDMAHIHVHMSPLMQLEWTMALQQTYKPNLLRWQQQQLKHSLSSPYSPADDMAAQTRNGCALTVSGSGSGMAASESLESEGLMPLRAPAALTGLPSAASRHPPQTVLPPAGCEPPSCAAPATFLQAATPHHCIAALTDGSSVQTIVRTIVFVSIMLKCKTNRGITLGTSRCTSSAHHAPWHTHDVTLRLSCQQAPHNAELVFGLCAQDPAGAGNMSTQS